MDLGETGEEWAKEGGEVHLKLGIPKTSHQLCRGTPFSITAMTGTEAECFKSKNEKVTFWVCKVNFRKFWN